MRRAKRLERMRQQPAGQKRDDIIALLEQYGFDRWDGANYTICRHPEHPDLRLSIPHQRRPKPYIVRQVVNMIDALEERSNP